MPKLNHSEIIDILAQNGLSGDLLECIQDLLVDADADMEPGDVHTLGMAFSSIGEELKDKAKAAIAPRIEGGRGMASRATSAGRSFEWHPESNAMLVNSAQVRAMFSKEDYPELYKPSRRKAHIRVL